MVTAPQPGQMDSGVPREGGLRVSYRWGWFPQHGIGWDLRQVFTHKLFVDPGFFSSSWGYRVQSVKYRFL